jgi:pimeloyl-ACP methyl ester carboxylesterase
VSAGTTEDTHVRHIERLPSGLALHRCEPAEPRHPTLLLVHGFAGGAWYWEPWQRFLAARGWPTAALDLRGRPGSRPVTDLGAVSLHDYVADVREAAAHLGRPPVVGHSMGGLLVQKLVEAGGAAAAVLLCSMPPKGIFFARFSLVRRQLGHVWPMLASRPLQGRPEELEWIVLNRMPAAERRALAGRFQAESGTVARELSLGGLAVDASRVRCPLLAVSTSEDRFFAPRVGRRIAERYGCEHRHYDGHAHFVPMEPGWERIAGDVADWLEQVRPAVVT